MAKPKIDDLSEKAYRFALMLDRDGEAMKELAHYIEESWLENKKWYKDDMKILENYEN